MIQKSEYQSVKSRFWLFVLIWCVCLFGLACFTKNVINANILAGNPVGIFAVCTGWWILGASCVLLDNYRRTICTVCEDVPARPDEFNFWNHVLDFSGRASRREFWWGLISYGIIIWVAMAIILVYLRNGLLALVACLVFLVPLWALFVRRLHDIGRSGWWTLVPCVGALMCVASWFITIVWGITWFGGNVGTDIWGIIIYCVSALFIGILPARNITKGK